MCVLSKVDLRLAELVEQAETRNAIACAVSRGQLQGKPAEVRPFSSGYLVSETPHEAAVVGAGRRGRLSPGEVAQMHRFLDRVVHLCPAIGASLHHQLTEMGYRECDEMVVMACAPVARDVMHRPAIVVQPVHRSTRLTWARTVTAGFAEVDEVPEGDATAGLVIADIPGVSCFLASDLSGEPLGGGAMVRYGRVAILFGDSTLPKARGRGVQKELIRRRVLNATATNCELATALTAPGSASQKNYERTGFKAAYTRVTLASAA